MNGLPQLLITANNTDKFAVMAKEIMEDSDHIHAGLNDNGLVFVYPCGCEYVYLFELSLLQQFVEVRNITKANGSQYDVLHSIINMIEQAEATKFEPKQEAEVLDKLYSGEPVQKRGEAKYDDRPNLLEMLAEKIREQIESAPKVWEVNVQYHKYEDDEFGTLSFSARDLIEAVDKLNHMDFKKGDEISMTFEFVGPEDEA